MSIFSEVQKWMENQVTKGVDKAWAEHEKEMDKIFFDTKNDMNKMFTDARNRIGKENI
jgi:hypothetical protein